MRTIMKITDPALWIECKYDEKDAEYPYRVYKLCRYIGQCGYPTVHRERIMRCASLHEVLGYLSCLAI